MFCNNCGSQNAEGVKFCSNCGAPLSAPAQETTVLNQNQQGVQQPVSPVQPPVSPVQSPVSPAQPPKKPNGKMIGIICGVAVAVIAVIVAVVLIITLGGKDKKKDSEGEKNKPSSKVENVQKTTENTTESTTEEPSTTPAMSYQEIVLAYVEAVYGGDFLTAKSYCLLDMSNIFEKYAMDSGKDINELYAQLSEIYSNDFGRKVDIKSVDDVYKLGGEEVAKLTSNVDIKFKVTEMELVDLNDSTSREYLIGDIIDCDWIGGLIDENNYTDYVDMNKISEAYEVAVEMSDGSDTTEESFYVVNYNGEWRVVSDPMSDF